MTSTMCVFALAGMAATGLAQTTNVVTLTTFEYESFDPPVPPGRPTYGYAYKYDWGGTPPEGFFHAFATTAYDPADTALTNILGQFTFDNTVYADFVANNPGSGYGFGFGGGLNWTNTGAVFTSTNREDYILSFDARAEGLKAGLTSIGGEFQIRFDAPDDTIAPADVDTDKDVLVQVNLNFNAGTNWQHHVFTLDQGNINGGKTMLDFILHRALIDEPRFGVNFHMPHDNWGYDGDNALYIDNIRLDVVQQLPPPPAPPKVPLAVFDYNWDDKPIWSAWNETRGANLGWSAGAQATYWVTNNAVGAGVAGSLGYVMAMDNTAMAGNVPAWAGGNTGGNGPADYSQLKSPDLADYRVVLDGRVAGLNPAKLTTSGTLQLHVTAPDDTIQPPDADTDNDFLIRLDFTVPDLQTNWQTITLALNKASVGQGSKANFTSYFDKVSEIQFQFQINNSASEADWSFDDDNLMIIDNFKLERLQVACPPLSVTTSGQNIVVSWAAPSTGTVKLQSAVEVNGPYTEVVGATSPHSTPIAGGPKYFRTLWVPPAP